MEFEEERSESYESVHDENVISRLKEFISSGNTKSAQEVMHTTCKCDLFRETGFWPKVLAKNSV